MAILLLLLLLVQLFDLLVHLVLQLLTVFVVFRSGDFDIFHHKISLITLLLGVATIFTLGYKLTATC